MPDSPSSIGKASPREGETGKLKIFLGFAPGVGKTYQMLEEAHRRQRRGGDVVAAAVETEGRAATEGMMEGIPLAPMVSLTDALGNQVFEIDVAGVIALNPRIALVDDLGHINAPGSKNTYRWQDVEELLAGGVNVLATLNVHQLESLSDSIADILDSRVTSSVPDRILHDAEEVEVVDLTPRALRNRLERGDILPSDQIQPAMDGFFREGNLRALRELAFREATNRADEDLLEYRKEKRIEKPWAAKDRVMICISPTRSSLRLIRRGWRMGQRMQGEVIAVHVLDGSSSGEREQKILQEDLQLCARLGIQTDTLTGPVSQTLVHYVKEKNVTAVILGHPERSRFQEMVRGSILTELARELKTVDLIVVATETIATSG